MLALSHQEDRHGRIVQDTVEAARDIAERAGCSFAISNILDGGVEYRPAGLAQNLQPDVGVVDAAVLAPVKRLESQDGLRS